MAFCCQILKAPVVKARLAFVWVAFDAASSCSQSHLAPVGAFLAWAEIVVYSEPQLRQPPVIQPTALSSGIQGQIVLGISGRERREDNTITLWSSIIFEPRGCYELSEFLQEL